MKSLDCVVGVGVVVACAGAALGQAADPFVFVSNNGNLEGSLTSLRVGSSGALSVVDRVVTGSRSSTSQDCPGCNSYAVSISPSGEFLATIHASGNGPENIIVYSVDADGMLTVRKELSFSQAGLDIQWIRDDLLAMAITNFGGSNQLRLYRWIPDTDSITLTDVDDAGGFFTSMALHPNGRWLYANDSSQNRIRLFDIDGDTASLVQNLSIPVFGTELKLTEDGSYLYAAGGISSGGNAFAAYSVDPGDGMLSLVGNGPFTSPGASPKGFAVSGDVLFVSHGTDATVRSFLIDPSTGAPTSTGNSFDVGLQGTLREIAAVGDLLFAIDETTAIDGVRGVYSFRVMGDGSFPVITPTPVDTQGISPNGIAVWAGLVQGCNAADLAEPFGALTFADITAYLIAFNAMDASADLAAPVGSFTFADINAFLAAFNAGCP
jgi:6-phosphogluconolactonase (cycloisomerase 2 family)